MELAPPLFILQVFATETVAKGVIAGEGWNRGGMNFCWELRVAASILKVHRGGGQNFLSYTTSNMHVNTTARPYN